jgi:hypothetical protein
MRGNGGSNASLTGPACLAGSASAKSGAGSACGTSASSSCGSCHASSHAGSSCGDASGAWVGWGCDSGACGAAAFDSRTGFDSSSATCSDGGKDCIAASGVGVALADGEALLWAWILFERRVGPEHLATTKLRAVLNREKSIGKLVPSLANVTCAAGRDTQINQLHDSQS